MDFNIITERPDDMSFEDYKKLRKLQQLLVKNKLKGKLVWLSKLKDTPAVRKFLKEEKLDDAEKFASLLEKGITYRKDKANV